MTQAMLSFLALLAVAPTLHAQSVSLAPQTLSSNLSRTATITSTSASPGATCCVLQPDRVGLDFWYTSRLEKVVATVLTQYLQYNNTVLTSTTTITKPNATYVWPTTSLIPGVWIYTITSQVNYTATSIFSAVVASPTPFVDIGAFKFISGTIDSSLGYCTTKDGGQPLDTFQGFRTPFAYVENPPETRTEHDMATVAPDSSKFIEHWISETPTITNIVPDARDCSVIGGTGEPTVHVPVTALTVQETTTVQMRGIAPGPPAADPTKAPLPSSDKPISSAAPAQNPHPPSGQAPPEQAPPSLPGQPSGAPETPPNQPGAQVPGSSPGQSQGVASPVRTQGPTTTDGQQNQPPVPLVPVPSKPGVILPNSQTLQPGSTTVVLGHTVALPASPPVGTSDGGHVPSVSSVVIVDGTTYGLNKPTEPAQVKGEATVMSITIGSSVVSFLAPIATGAPVLIPMGSTTVTLLPGSTVVLSGQTLVLSAEPSKTVIQILDATTTKEVAVPTNPNQTVDKTGTGGVGSQGPNSTQAKPAQFTGGAGHKTLVSINCISVAVAALLLF